MIPIKDVEDCRIDALFESMKDNETSFVLKIFSLFVFQSCTTDISDLYKAIGIEPFIEVLSLYDGRTVRFPTKDEIREFLLLALLYYFREIEKKSWEEIKKEIPFEISSVSYGLKLSSFNSYIKQKLQELVNKINQEVSSGG